MEALAIAPDTVVTLSYVLFDERGEAVDRAGDDEPLRYVHGYAQIVPGLERHVEGLHAGDRREFTLLADEAFGDRDEDAVFEVDKNDFPEAGDVAVGDEFMAEGEDGEPIIMRVLELRSDGFLVDANHPLAGQKIRVEVAVAGVRAASEAEIAEAQAGLEAAANACGCGHDHGDAHDHDHEAHDHGPEAAAPELIQLGKKN